MMKREPVQHSLVDHSWTIHRISIVLGSCYGALSIMYAAAILFTAPENTTALEVLAILIAYGSALPLILLGIRRARLAGHCLGIAAVLSAGTMYADWVTNPALQRVMSGALLFRQSLVMALPLVVFGLAFASTSRQFKQQSIGDGPTNTRPFAHALRWAAVSTGVISGIVAFDLGWNVVVDSASLHSWQPMIGALVLGCGLLPLSILGIFMPRAAGLALSVCIVVGNIFFWSIEAGFLVNGIASALFILVSLYGFPALTAALFLTAAKGGMAKGLVSAAE